MDKIEKIRQEIERLKGICMAQIKTNPGQAFPFVMEMTGYDKLLSFIDTLSEKPGKSMEEAAGRYEAYYDVGEEHGYLYCLAGDIKNAFIAGAEWQKQQEVDLEKVVMIDNLIMNLAAEGYNDGYKTRPFYEEVLRRFNAKKQ